MVEDLIQKKSINRKLHLINSGANLIDSGESTRPGSKAINENLEWKELIKF